MVSPTFPGSMDEQGLLTQEQKATSNPQLRRSQQVLQRSKDASICQLEVPRVISQALGSHIQLLRTIHTSHIIHIGRRARLAMGHHGPMRRNDIHDCDIRMQQKSN
jgi:hypothetical protein